MSNLNEQEEKLVYQLLEDTIVSRFDLEKILKDVDSNNKLNDQQKVKYTYILKEAIKLTTEMISIQNQMIKGEIVPQYLEKWLIISTELKELRNHLKY